MHVSCALCRVEREKILSYLLVHPYANMFGFAAALLLASVQLAWSQDVFPTCDDLLRESAFEGVNLLKNARGIKNIITTECVQPIDGENR
jgi:hypothetical protein